MLASKPVSAENLIQAPQGNLQPRFLDFKERYNNSISSLGDNCDESEVSTNSIEVSSVSPVGVKKILAKIKAKESSSTVQPIRRSRSVSSRIGDAISAFEQKDQEAKSGKIPLKSTKTCSVIRPSQSHHALRSYKSTSSLPKSFQQKCEEAHNKKTKIEAKTSNQIEKSKKDEEAIKSKKADETEEDKMVSLPKIEKSTEIEEEAKAKEKQWVGQVSEEIVEEKVIEQVKLTETKEKDTHEISVPKTGKEKPKEVQEKLEIDDINEGGGLVKPEVHSAVSIEESENQKVVLSSKESESYKKVKEVTENPNECEIGTKSEQANGVEDHIIVNLPKIENSMEVEKETKRNEKQKEVKEVLEIVEAKVPKKDKTVEVVEQAPKTGVDENVTTTVAEDPTTVEPSTKENSKEVKEAKTIESLQEAEETNQTEECTEIKEATKSIESKIVIEEKFLKVVEEEKNVVEDVEVNEGEAGNDKIAKLPKSTVVKEEKKKVDTTTEQNIDKTEKKVDEKEREESVEKKEAVNVEDDISENKDGSEDKETYDILNQKIILISTTSALGSSSAPIKRKSLSASPSSTTLTVTPSQDTLSSDCFKRLSGGLEIISDGKELSRPLSSGGLSSSTMAKRERIQRSSASLGQAPSGKGHRRSLSQSPMIPARLGGITHRRSFRRDGTELLGLDAEINDKLEAKRDKNLERELIEWICDVLNQEDTNTDEKKRDQPEGEKTLESDEKDEKKKSPPITNTKGKPEEEKIITSEPESNEKEKNSLATSRDDDDESKEEILTTLDKPEEKKLIALKSESATPQDDEPAEEKIKTSENKKITLSYDEENGDFVDPLANGIILCQLINKIVPNSVPVYNKNANHPLAQRDNITCYLEACTKIGLSGSAMFGNEDLSKKKDIGSVCANLNALARHAAGIEGFSPVFKRVKLIQAKPSKRWDPVEMRSKYKKIAAESVVCDLNSSNDNIDSSDTDGEPRLGRFKSFSVIKRGGSQVFGMDAEMAAKMEGNRDLAFEKRQLIWIETVLGLKFETDSFVDELADGIALCKMVNFLSPNMIKKINTRKIPMLLMENAKLYLDACVKLGMVQADLFSPNDLYKKEAPTAVSQNITRFSRICAKTPSFTAPLLIIARRAPSQRISRACKSTYDDPSLKAGGLQSSQSVRHRHARSVSVVGKWEPNNSTITTSEDTTNTSTPTTGTTTTTTTTSNSTTTTTATSTSTTTDTKTTDTTAVGIKKSTSKTKVNKKEKEKEREREKANKSTLRKNKSVVVQPEQNIDSVSKKKKIGLFKKKMKNRSEKNAE